MRSWLVIGLLALLSACNDGQQSNQPDGAGSASPDGPASGRAEISAKLIGTLYFNYDAPLENPQVMALDLKSKHYRIAADGVDAAAQDGLIAFIQDCDPLNIRLATVDADGFPSPVSDCVRAETFGHSLQGPAISPDGRLIAILNHKTPEPPASDHWSDNLIEKFMSVLQVYDLDGNLVAAFEDMGPATWLRDGRLVMAGRGGDGEFGLFLTDKDLKAFSRVDDGRIKSVIDAIDAHPHKDRVAFILNNQLFDMALDDGKPKRLYAHSQALAGLAYSPDGSRLAMISEDTLDEALSMEGEGYPIFVLRNGKTDVIRLPFVVSGPLDWTE